MAPISRIKFAIAYAGFSQCGTRDKTRAINLSGTKSEVLAQFIRGDLTSKQGHLKWCLPSNNHRTFLEKQMVVIPVTPQVANTKDLIARVFKTSEVSSRRMRQPDGIVVPETMASPIILPIEVNR